MYVIYRISSNKKQRRSLFFSLKKGAIIQGKANIRGRRLFRLSLTGSRALNFLFYYPIKTKKMITYVNVNNLGVRA